MANVESPRWTILTAPAEYARNSHSCIVYKHFLIIHGGENRGTWFNDTLIYNLKTSTWEKQISGAENPMKRRYNYTACLYENSNRIIYFGGESKEPENRGTILDDIFIATLKDTEDDCIEIEWEKIDLGDKPRLCRNSHLAHLYRGDMYVIGGRGSDKKFCDQLWCLDKEYNWTQKKIQGDIFSTGLTKSAIFQHRIFLYGGDLSDGTKFGSNTFYALDLETFEGRLLYIPGTPLPRFGHTIEQYNGKLYVFGGCAKGACNNDLFSFDIEKEEWEAIKPAGDPPQRMGHHTCVVYEGSLVVFGGENSSGALNELCILKLEGSDDVERVEKNMSRPKTSHYLKDLKTMFENKKYSDVCFEVEGQKFYCHKNILGARCQFFDSMFNSQMMESQAEKIEISDVKAPIFKELLRFIYCDEVQLTEENVIELLILVDKYFLKDLKAICVEFLTKTLTLENFVSRGQVAETYEINSLRKAVVDFGSRNISKLRENGTFVELSNSILADIVYKLQDKISLIEKNRGTAS